MKNEYLCKVCGYESCVKPWGDDGKTPSYEICDCCGVEWGNEDYTFDSLIEFRKKWIAAGLKWFSENIKPLNWNFENQILLLQNNIEEEKLKRILTSCEE